MRRNANLNVRVNLAQRERFRQVCHKQGTTIEAIVPKLMQKFIDGELSFEFKNNGAKSK